MAALELALRIRPEELATGIEIARLRLSEEYGDVTFSPDLTSETERSFLSSEVERLMRGLQADLGFKGGIAARDQG